MTSKHINLNIFPLILSESDAEKTRFLSAKMQKKTNFFHDDGIQKFEVIYEEQVMAHIQNHTKHDFET
jgi:hypothetical protein